ncbi:MAG: hypothetical protein KF756_00805 [Acidobacteria bacterium]|nr:hypothetical protein [Acidobacteriota bacterium]
MKKVFLTVALCLAAAASAFSQTLAPSPTPTPDPEKEKAQTIAFLRDLDQEISNLRLPENRVSFYVELASVMWQLDEQQARGIYAKSVGDLRQMISIYENERAEAKAAEAADKDALTASFVDMSFRSPLSRTAVVLVQLRKQIVLSIAERDIDLAMTALADTAGIVIDDAYRDTTDEWLLNRIAERAATRSPKQALALALEALKKGLDGSHFQVIRQLYEVDSEAAKTLGDAMLTKAKEDETDAATLGEFLRVADALIEKAKKPSAKPSPFSEADARQIAGLLADKLQRFDGYGSLAYLHNIEKYLPARAMALKARAASMAGNANSVIPERRTRSASSNANSAVSAEQEKWKKRSEDSEKLQAFAKLAEGKLPKEEREKVLAEARKTITRIRDPRDKVIALSAIATAVAPSDKELALQLMAQAEQFAPLYPRTSADYLVALSVASGYAMVEPDKAYPRIEALIASSNDIITAGARVIEFIDPEGTMVSDGELRLGGLIGPTGGGLVSNLSFMEMPLRRLAEFDLERTRALADRFDRPEARVLGKILILRSFAQKFNRNEVVPDAGPEKAEAQPDDVN